ncbi:MAG: hypothetical protein JNK14_19335 [Chitinophagaceae bacterium]|nr:hypothetical protein [Chitinophagaceae bacterium]
MKNKWLIIAVLFPAISFSQGSASSKGELAAITSVGLAAGESIAKPLFQFSTGMNFRKWFAGVGAGADLYKFTSYPVFADLRMSFGKGLAGFVYANGGYNISDGANSHNNNFFKTTDKFTGGLYMDAGVGYRIKLGTMHQLLFSAGYSQKNLSNRVGYTYPCFVEPCPEEIYDYRYKLGRIVAKLSWELGKMR